MREAIKEALASSISQEVVLERPKKKEFGHYATPVAFSLAKTYKKNPKIIAEELCEQLRCHELFESVEPLNGYINLKLSEEFLDRYTTWALKNPQDFGCGVDKPEKILLEFVSANPTGPLHIGHARGAIFGDALLRIGRHLGHDITSEYYVNDAGNQVHLLGLSLYLAGREALGLPVEYPESYYRGEYINDVAETIRAELGDEPFQDEAGIPQLADRGKDLMLEEIKSNLAQAGIRFDRYVSEKSLMNRWNTVCEELKDGGALYDEEGKIWIRSSEHGDEKDRVVVRDNGGPTYLAGDIIYHHDKFKRGYDRCINIWGADHHGYIARVKAAVAFMGHDPKKLEVLLSQMVSLLKEGEPYKMSKRAGNFILMRDVVEEIGKDALRLVFLSKKSDTHLEFDVSELSREDASNPIFYINYAHARIHTLFEKSGKTMTEVIGADLTGIHQDAKDLLFLALTLPQVLEEAFTSRQIQKVVDYLNKQLAAALHSFYNTHKIIGSEQEDKLLKVFAMVALSIATALSLLGIEAKTKM